MGVSKNFSKEAMSVGIKGAKMNAWTVQVILKINLRQGSNINEENSIFRSSFGPILGKISKKLISVY